MTEGTNFNTPNEELAYLRAKVLEQEKKFERLGVETGREQIVRDSVKLFEREAGVAAPVAQHVAAERDAEVLMERHEEVQLER